jgi:mannose-6-phosphate isomerase class I
MDIGIFSVYFLNYVVITEDMPNRFIYCAPDEPHAYLCGDAVECMAMSDNVVRAGLTQKFKDVDTLLRMMTWRDDLLDDLVNVGERIKPHVVKYDPPVEDFMVYEVDGPVPEGIVLDRAAIVACISGSFVLDFRTPAPEDGDNQGKAAEIFAGADAPFSWRGEKRVIKGNTFFSRAGTELIVKSAREGSKLFIATY